MESRNLLIAVVASVGILLSWQFLYEQPRVEQEMAARQAQQQTAGQQAPTGQPPSVPAVPGTSVPATPGAGAPPAPDAAGVQAPGAPPVIGAPGAAGPDRKVVLGRDTRIRIESPRVHGSVRIKGGQIDDLTLIDYHQTPDPKTPEITLLSPNGAALPYYAQFGWVSGGNEVPVPDAETPWKASGTTLAPERPVVLSWDNGQGLVFERTIALDRNYMFSVTQKVTNNGRAPVTLYPYALISRTGTPDTLGFYILHEGLVGVFDGTLKEVDYDDLQDAGTMQQRSTGGWIGISDKYWLTALIPDQKAPLQMRFSHTGQGKQEKYQADYLGGGQTVPAGQSAALTNRLFAGAKEVGLLDEYTEKLGIARFDLAVDWGWFYFLTKPIFYVLEYFYGLLGNFGLGILLLTVLIKAVFFPLANKSYAAMSRLKALQPKMTEIRDRYKDDRAKQNEAMMRLYKEENANPMAGCLPIIVQIPVFFALYKVLFVSIEMRHAPFFGWIRDLSAPDPTSLFNLFGLIPWTPPDMLHIGVWPLIMGGTMWLQQKLNPQPADPTQAKVMMFLPVVFTVMLAQFPAGLVIYWAWNNMLSICQQWLIMRRMGVSASGETTKKPAGGSPKGGGKPAGSANANKAGAGAANRNKGRTNKPKGKGKGKAGAG
ncbi:MAG: membrane protein insertase YidC [Alphaproteobacteria bacterium]|nr:membrane protein insertase YidC [Alphaproteobacteria bacterium]